MGIAGVHWYNHEHRHSAIGFVTPAQRHMQVDRAILDDRAKVYAAARHANPNHASLPQSGNAKEPESTNATSRLSIKLYAITFLTSIGRYGDKFLPAPRLHCFIRLPEHPVPAFGNRPSCLKLIARHHRAFNPPRASAPVWRWRAN